MNITSLGMCELSGGLFNHHSLSAEASLCSSLSNVSLPKGNLVEVWKYFYEKGLHTDITFNVKCGDGFISFSCHKLVLSLISPVFADKFYSNTEGADKEDCDEIDVSDVPPSAFAALIQYCYDIETELHRNRNDVNYLLKVYKAAQKYEVETLKTFCYDMFNTAQPNKDNVFELLNAANMMGSEGLKLRCYHIVKTRTRQILSSRDISSLDPTTISTILDMDSLSLRSEYDLLTWLFDWGSYMYRKCLEQDKADTFLNIMSPFLPRLYPISLTAEEFGKLAEKYKEFFDEREGFAIFMNIVLPSTSFPLPPWCNETRRSPRSYDNNV